MKVRYGCLKNGAQLVAAQGYGASKAMQLQRGKREPRLPREILHSRGANDKIRVRLEPLNPRSRGSSDRGFIEVTAVKPLCATRTQLS